MEDKYEYYSQHKKERQSPIIVRFIPHLTSFPLTIIFLTYCLNSNCLVNFFNLTTISNEINFQQKVSLLARISSWIAVLVFFKVQFVIVSRIYTKTGANPFRLSILVDFFNRVLSNTVEQTLVFLPLLANFILNDCTTDAQLKNAISLSIFWILGRIIFFITYYIGYLIDYPILRMFGFLPTIFPSIILIIRLAGVNMLLTE
jgi:hypothetical protein